MKIVKQSWDFLRPFEAPFLLKKIEQAGRLCYKSEDKITDDSDKIFVKKAIDIEHYSIIEHGAISVKIITDRGVTHELVRHRLASYSQESTRYCNYSKDKFGNEITVVLPVWFEEVEIKQLGGYSELRNIIENQYIRWHNTCVGMEEGYFDLLKQGQTPQEARSVLPNSLKTEIVMTANPREWRHVFNLRCSPKAHPQIRELMLDMLKTFKNVFPVLFDDILPEVKK